LLVALSTLVTVVVVWSRPAGAQAPPARLDERVRSTTDTSQTFALYLPPGYTAERRWPVLFVLDPRGRALPGLKRFEDGAARRGHVAGVIAVGGALGFAMGGPETAFAADSTFAYFGSAGTQDFNYEEVFALADRFRTTRVPFRVVPFDGPHGWPPPDVCGAAL